MVNSVRTRSVNSARIAWVISGGEKRDIPVAARGRMAPPRQHHAALEDAEEYEAFAARIAGNEVTRLKGRRSISRLRLFHSFTQRTNAR